MRFGLNVGDIENSVKKLRPNLTYLPKPCGQWTLDSVVTARALLRLVGPWELITSKPLG
jgi:hypothetical protein